LKSGNYYFAVDDGIWFIADKPEGPWKVSDQRPEEVDKIPPESEAYNVKYVYIYDATPDVVHVGYLPGYTWSFVYGGCVVYGTGYWYRPWYHHYYYPRPVTWGFGVHWNPYTGWGFSFGLSFGWVGWRFHPYAGWWGPRGFYPGYRHGFYHGYRRAYYHGMRRGYYAGRRAAYNNVYRYRMNRGVVRTGMPRQTRNLNHKARPANRPNNVYTDKKGNIYMRDKGGSWKKIDNKRQPRNTAPSRKPSDKVSTRPATRPAQKPATRPSTQPVNKKPQSRPTTQPVQKRPQTRPATRPSGGGNMSPQKRQQLQRAYQNRARGNTSFNRSRSYRGAARGRVGGMRRR